jgi:hypothetical protein
MSFKGFFRFENATTITVATTAANIAPTIE